MKLQLFLPFSFSINALVSIPNRDLMKLQSYTRFPTWRIRFVSIPNRDLMKLQWPGFEALDIFSFQGSISTTT